MKIYKPEVVTDYLNNKVIKNWLIECNYSQGIETAIIVPAICEFENLKKLLFSLTQNHQDCLQKCVIIFVINNSKSSGLEIKEDNQQSLSLLRSLVNRTLHNEFASAVYNSGIKLGLIDASSPGKEFVDKDAGVGLARKTGLDAALSIFDYSTETKKILISLDADCLVEQNYLSAILNKFNEDKISVATVEFEHQIPKDLANRLGIISYEIYLRHYVAGLLFANSPFAFHTIGSTIVCDHEAYIKVGGMNVKKAAEDFYFLEKLAKHYKVRKINSTKVYPSSRKSWRVPFGTGRSITDYVEHRKEISVYDPEIYLILKNWIELFYSDLIFNPDLILNEVGKIHNQLLIFLKQRKFFESWSRILQNSKSIKQIDYQRKNWFDAFETLKLVHHLRDTSLPLLDIELGVQKFFKIIKHPSAEISIGNGTSKERIYMTYLSQLRQLEGNLTENT